MEGCIQDAEQQLGWRPVHFSCPYGRSNKQIRLVVREVGLRSATASGSALLIQPGADRFALARIEPPQSMALFRFMTSGAYPRLPLVLVGRA